MATRRLLLLILSICLPLAADAQQRLTRAKDADGATQSAAAQRLRMNLDRFREMAARQPSLHVSASGDLVYKCARARRPAAARTVGEDNSTFIAPAPKPLAETFALHSRPGSARVLYLDFDGHVLTGTGWNEDFADPVEVAAFDIDGDPAAFSDAERTVIQQIWRRVAEDFAPFDVDVTTEDPGVDAIISNAPGDDNVGVRALIGDDAAYIGEDPDGLLGLALLGTFGGDVDNPALIFSVAHGDDYALIADTVSHEVGHTLALEHHGSDVDGEYYQGHGNWAPIMGSGSSDMVTQWSRGDYAGATNPTQDDIAVILGFIPLAPPDHPLDQAGAEEIFPADVATGTLRTSESQAWYRFSAGRGNVTFTGSVASLGPNLKLGLSILDADGNVVASSATGNARMSALLSANLPSAGIYYLVVDGIGYLDVDTGFTDYASLGRFSVTGSWQVNRPPLAFTAGSTPLLGRAPLTVTFNGLGSFDFDGSIASYSWSFSDGQVATGPTPTVTFATPGNYTATLTVADNSGDSATTQVIAVATPKVVANRPIRVGAASVKWVAVSRTAGRAQATVRILDSGGRPLPGVTVVATTSGLAEQVVTAVTDRAGNALLRTDAIPSSSRGAVTFTVRGATLTGYAYLPAQNKVTSVTLRR